jgi:hypothetical protein
MKEYVTKSLASDLFFWEERHLFDQPTQARMLLGVIEYVNDFISRKSETLHVLYKDETLMMFFNCKKGSVQEVLNKPPIGRENTEVNFAQNFLDNLGIPIENYIDKTLVDRMQHENVRAKIKSALPLDSLPPTQIRFMKDPEVLSKLDMNKLQMP